MKILVAIIIILLAVIIYVFLLKFVCWMIDFDKKTDKKMFNAELEDYKSDKQCAIAEVTIVFAVITIGLLYLFFTRW